MQVLSALNSPLPQGFIYTTDVRTKMLISAFASIGSIYISSLEGQMLLVASSFFYALSLGRIKIILLAYVFIAIMGAMALGCAHIMSLIFPVMKNSVGMSLLIPFLRLLTMVHVILPLALSSRIQNILNALRSLHLPFCLYLPSAVAIRFIPTFLHDVEQVVESLKLQGYQLGIYNLTRHPILSLRLFCAPLLFRCLRTAEDLGLAAELKGMSAKHSITAYHKPVLKSKDYALLGLTTIIFCSAIYCEHIFPAVGRIM